MRILSSITDMSPAVLIVDDGNVVDDNGKDGDITNGDGRSALLHRSLHHDPLHAVYAEGNYLHLSNGQRILDATGGAAVACIGHGNVQVQEALMQQMSQVSYCHSLFYATSASEDLAQILIDSTDGEMARVFIASSGSEAMEAALKLARQYHLEKANPEPSRCHFISRQQSYHGTTLGALAAGGHVARRAIFEPILSINTSRVSPCYAYRGLSSVLDTESAYVRRLEAELEAEFVAVGPNKVAAFIAEPVVGAALGCVPPSPGYFAAMRRVCNKYGALLIFDEIMSGAGRTGPAPSHRYPKPLHAWQDSLVGITPDIMTMGKGLGGGYMPVAAMLANKKVVNALERGTGAFSHGQTYQGHPLACRAALEVQRIIRDNDLVTNVRKQGALLGRLLHKKLSNHAAVGNIRGRGLFWGIEFVQDKITKEPFDPSEGIAMAIHELGMQHPYNISLYPGTGSADGRRGDHILIAPAYNITADEIRKIVDTVAAVTRQYFLQNHQEWLMLHSADAQLPEKPGPVHSGR
ncbi:hypothetical protein DOTSEDRAFT_69875 [Dothistroma septosporum NZE10]|uniref:Aminotransferase-like protein n=1 Tax=Dothistroma septosporum (strain NZE10 / CBS 128990) TaxID=675120 RepID=N1PYM9_DOTSN|nr:hypothetical protein DOTSEDRAFT_69875 [Dothistroma septosporum NZE10]